MDTGDLSLPSDDQLDAMLLAQVRDRWLKTARVVANALLELEKRDGDGIWGRMEALRARLALDAPPEFEDKDGDRITHRMEALIARGKIECAGDVRKWRFSEVRLAPPGD
jgi:Protein of unknown function